MITASESAPAWRPLADRMRPQSAEELVGQSHLLAADKPLARLLRADPLHSAILWGPPGSGKTTVARLRMTSSFWASSGRVIEPSMIAMSYSWLCSLMASRHSTTSTRSIRFRISSSRLTICNWQPSQHAKSNIATLGLLILDRLRYIG